MSRLPFNLRYKRWIKTDKKISVHHISSLEKTKEQILQNQSFKFGKFFPYGIVL